MKNKNDWIETDDSCLQHCKYRGNRVYDFIQMIWLDNAKDESDNYIVVAETIDLDDYGKDEIELAVLGYYDNYQTALDIYGKDNIDQIVAECIFENMTYTDFRSDVISEKDAEFVIKTYIDSDGRRFLCNNELIEREK